MIKKNSEKWDIISGMTEAEIREVRLHNNLFSPTNDPKLIGIFEDLLEVSKKYKHISGRHLPIYGELGEIYAEIMFGIKRNKPNAAGSDGRRGMDHIEVKTISPFKKSDIVEVKRLGNFNQLLVVKINEKHEFSARLAFRKSFPKGKSKMIKIKWTEIKEKYQ